MRLARFQHNHVGRLAGCFVQARQHNRASVTQRVGALVDDGLLATSTDPTDSRANVVALTARGAALLDAAWSGLDAHQAGLDDGVDEAALAAQLDRILANGARLESR